AQLPMLTGFVIVIALSGPVGLIGLIFSLMMFGLSLVIPKRSEKGQLFFEEIKRYRNALKKGPGAPFKEEDMGLHFVYAIALDLSEKKLTHLLSDVKDTNPIFYWIVASSLVSNPSQIASGLTRLASSGTESFGGTSGFGASGGISGGGTGGGAR
ncbi:hypothetical protein QLX67_11395, partial [Balneolaceae bacterium ANBcel3]|nr:hypothetical protein [Balneolaceae bacterium ANBcel3]